MFAQKRRERWKMMMSMCYIFGISNLSCYDLVSTSKKKRKKTATKVKLLFFSICNHSCPTGYSPPPIPGPFKERYHCREQNFWGDEIWFAFPYCVTENCVKSSSVVMSDPKSRTGEEDKKTISKMSVFVSFDISGILTCIQDLCQWRNLCTGG